jgi:hypothetical protein
MGFIQVPMGCRMDANTPLKHFGKLRETAVRRFVPE